MSDLRDRVQKMTPYQMRDLLTEMAETAPRWLRDFAEKFAPMKPYKEGVSYRTYDGYDLTVLGNLTNLKSLSNDKPTKYVTFSISKKTLPFMERKNFPNTWVLTELQFETAIEEGIEDFVKNIGRVS
jgi:hypothetical protein